LPGLVGALPVAVGQDRRDRRPHRGQKMQNILKAGRDGVVKAVSAKAGDPVAADDMLVEFE
ncbi:MAG: hypothetical protein K0M78_10140, partial [Brevundimonas sp.]|nr:hypothetical protein [Brevundimonas sp.]